MHTSSLSQLGFTLFWTQYMCIVCQKRPFELFNSVAKEHLIINISVGQEYSSPPSSIVQTWKSEGRFFKPDLGLVCLDTPTLPTLQHFLGPTHPSLTTPQLQSLLILSPLLFGMCHKVMSNINISSFLLLHLLSPSTTSSSS